MNSYDIARKIVHMPGIQMEAWINPTLISPRIKNSVQRMIRTGILTGGYRSTARMLASQLLKDACIGVTASANKWGVTLFNAQLTPDTKGDIIELLEAARVLELMTVPKSNHDYVSARYKRAMALEIRPDQTIHMSCYVLAISKQIAERVSAERSQLHVETANRLADQLDDVAPIQANIFTPV